MVKKMKLSYDDIYNGTKIVLVSDKFCYQYEIGKLRFRDVNDEVILFETTNSGISSVALGNGAKKVEFVIVVYEYLLERYGK